MAPFVKAIAKVGGALAKAKGAAEAVRERFTMPREFQAAFRAHVLAGDDVLRSIHHRTNGTGVDRPDPLMCSKVAEYGELLNREAAAFALKKNLARARDVPCVPSDFLTAAEQRACRIAAYSQLFHDIDARAQRFAKEVNLTPRGTSAGSVSKPEAGRTDAEQTYDALRLLAFYDLCPPEKRPEVFAIIEYDEARCATLLSRVLKHMELGYRREEALMRLYRYGAPKELAQRALADNVMAAVADRDSEGAARRFVEVLRGARLPDELIARTWTEADGAPSLIESGLAADDE